MRFGPLAAALALLISAHAAYAQAPERSIEEIRLEAQSPPVDRAFHADFLRSNLLGNRECLFDVVPAFTHVVEGADTVDKLTEVFPHLSLVAEGLLGQPTGPMLIVGGAKDTQVPISDLELLLQNGDVCLKSSGSTRKAASWT